MLRIILVEDHELFREGLRALLAPSVTIVATAVDAHEARRVVARHEHDVVLVDITLPGPSGVALLRDLKRADPQCRVLMLSMHHHLDVVADALDAGADGYALKDQSPAELLEAIYIVGGGGRYLAPALRQLAQRTDGGSGARGLLRALSRREREVFDLLVRGYGNDEVSQQLYISVKTVETHRTRIMRKLDVHSMAEMVRLAARHGHLAA
ncbi:MAG TPA: response regulator transcription factor [Polyangia bacterium]|nr:response regulator transcription factor [Polyangia bacterium]